MKNLLKKTIVVAMALMMAAVFMPFVPGVNYVANADDCTHEWKYTVSGDTITAICNLDCGTSQTLKIAAADGVYGTPYVGANVDSSQWTASGLADAPQIEYYGATKLSEAPTAVGSYEARITVGGKTAKAAFKIEPKALTVSSGIATVKTKIYDGNTNAQIEIDEDALTGVETGDEVQIDLANTKATFADKKVGSSKTVNVKYALKGKNKGSYKVADGTLTGTISPKEVTVSAPFVSGGSIGSMEYNGTTAFSKELGINNLVSGDKVKAVLSGTLESANYSTANIKLSDVSVANLSGDDAANYTFKNQTELNQTLAEGTYYAKVSKKAVTVTFADKSSTKNADLVELTHVDTGLVGGQSLTGVQADATVIDKTKAGVYKIYPSAEQISAAASANPNYKITYVAGRYVVKGEQSVQYLAFSKDVVNEYACGDTFTLKALGYTDSTYKTTKTTSQIEYTSDNEKVATVDKSTGKVTVVGKGTATITATALEDATHQAASATYTLVVTAGAKVEVPTIADLVYNGQEQVAFTVPANALYTVSSASVLKATKAGTYTVVFSLKNTVDYSWSTSKGTTTDNQTITWKITPKPIKVKANNQSSLVGEALKTLTYTSDALCGSDKLTGALATTANKDKAGTYDITQGTLAAGSNYTITFTKGTYTVKNVEAKTKFMAKAKAYKSKFAFSWTNVSGAKYYRVYYKNMKKTSFANHKVTGATSWTWSSTKYIKKNNVYKARVKAFNADGEVIATSPYMYLVPTYSTKTNATKVTPLENELTLKIGTEESAEALSKQTKYSSSKKLLSVSGVRTVRYQSADTSVVKVLDGNEITAVGKGVAKVYAISLSGAWAVIDVEVL